MSAGRYDTQLTITYPLISGGKLTERATRAWADLTCSHLFYKVPVFDPISGYLLRAPFPRITPL